MITTKSPPPRPSQPACQRFIVSLINAAPPRIQMPRDARLRLASIRMQAQPISRRAAEFPGYFCGVYEAPDARSSICQARRASRRCAGHASRRHEAIVLARSLASRTRLQRSGITARLSTAALMPRARFITADTLLIIGLGIARHRSANDKMPFVRLLRARRFASSAVRRRSRCATESPGA